jgi:hypothetical protein
MTVFTGVSIGLKVMLVGKDFSTAPEIDKAALNYPAARSVGL